ncbi:MAG: heat-inducible transcriptional repressor HrcA, partial [Chitinivibrionales bacterium]|nr:heat-inducible transcriptional repressor HrcA [Chitinivibrionales bacterium]
MTTEHLEQRQHSVLEAIVRNYILNASPAGSRFVSRKTDLDLSPASIRNVMSDLEELGFIAQPHTSAGRVPTDKGYRYYVDYLMKLIELSDDVKQQIRCELGNAQPGDLRMVMEVATRALSKATHQLGIILAPKLGNAIFRHLHIVKMAAQRYLLALTIDSGFVKAMVLELTTEIPDNRLESACHVINERFYGKSLGEMCAIDAEGFSDLETFNLGIIRLFVPSIKKMIEERATEEIYTEGTTNIVLQPEFFNKDQVGAIIELLEEKKLLMHLFEMRQEDGGNVVISIGGENEEGR